MNSPAGIVVAGAVFVVCLQWTCVGASLSSGLVNNTVTDASVLDCKCNPEGSFNTTCEDPMAECLCRNGYEGPNCTDCQNGYYRHSNQCIACQCDVQGSLNPSCDRYGTCSCKTGVGGKQCNQCLNGYYHLTATGCKQCQCDQIISVCLYPTKKFRVANHPSMCQSCLQNQTWVNYCTESICTPSEYLTPEGVCKPCQCNQTQDTIDGYRHCNLTTGKCPDEPECMGETCSTGGPSQYRVYIIVSGAVTGVVIVVLAILLTVYCRRRCRAGSRRPQVPLWTIELRQDDEDEFDTTQELAFDDLDVMYLDDSYLMEPTPEYLPEPTENQNGRAGYHTLS